MIVACEAGKSMQKKDLLPIEDVREKILYSIWKLVDQKYVLFKERGINWDEVLKRYKENIKDISTYKELYEYINTMLLELHDPHTRVVYTPYNEELCIMPLFIKCTNGIYYINEVIGKYKLCKGMRLIKINNISIQEIQNRYIKYYKFQSRSYICSLLINDFHKGKFGDVIRITAKHGNTEVSEQVNTIKLGDNLEVFNKIRNNISLFNCKVYDDSIGYLKIISFFDKSMADIIEKEVKYMKNIRCLIIDIRENSGGLINCAKDIASLFVSAQVNLGYRVSRKNGGNHLEFEIPSELHIESKNLCNHIEKIIVLCDEFTMSSAEFIFLEALLKDKKRIYTIGKQTGGLAHGASLFTLFDGTKIQITTFKYLNTNMEVVQETGIVPDVEVENDIEEMVLGEDQQLKYAIKLCNSK